MPSPLHSRQTEMYTFQPCFYTFYTQTYNMLCVSMYNIYYSYVSNFWITGLVLYEFLRVCLFSQHFPAYFLYSLWLLNIKLSTSNNGYLFFLIFLYKQCHIECPCAYFLVHICNGFSEVNTALRSGTLDPDQLNQILPNHSETLLYQFIQPLPKYKGPLYSISSPARGMAKIS